MISGCKQEAMMAFSACYFCGEANVCWLLCHPSGSSLFLTILLTLSLYSSHSHSLALRQWFIIYLIQIKTRSSTPDSNVLRKLTKYNPIAWKLTIVIELLSTGNSRSGCEDSVWMSVGLCVCVSHHFCCVSFSAGCLTSLHWADLTVYEH